MLACDGTQANLDLLTQAENSLHLVTLSTPEKRVATIEQMLEHRDEWYQSLPSELQHSSEARVTDVLPCILR